LLGESQQASQHSEDAIALARRLDHPFSHTHALVFAAFLHRERGDCHACRVVADEAGAVAGKWGFVQLSARAAIMRGWAMTQAGETDAGITQMQEGIATIRRLGAVFLTYMLGALADGHAKAGRDAVALDVVTEALAIVERTGERFYESELLRLQGNLILSVRRDNTEAERCFRSALSKAHRQLARRLELRAKATLRQFLDRQGRYDEACQLDGIGGAAQPIREDARGGSTSI
jgi:predicted ATPase